MNKIIDNFNKLNDQARYGILAGVVVMILALDVFFLALPQWSSISDTNDQIQKLSDDTQRVVADKLRINLLRKNLEDSRGQLKTLSVKVRTKEEVSAILSTISSIAKKYGVKIDQLVPEYNQQENLATADEGQYYALPIVIKARCGYHMFGRFINKLEGENMYLMMKDFIIQNDDNNTSAHSFNLTIKIILLDRDPAPVKKS